MLNKVKAFVKKDGLVLILCALVFATASFNYGWRAGLFWSVFSFIGGYVFNWATTKVENHFKR